MKAENTDTLREVQIKLDTFFSKLKSETERVSLRQACRRFLAEDIAADAEAPGFRRSMTDGFAVRGGDTFGVSENVPVFLKATGVVQMGSPTGIKIGPGEAAYVQSGGMIPDGADAVVSIENIEFLEDKTISVNKPVAPNANLVNVGEDYKEAQRFYPKGHRVEAKDIGLLAACGKASVLVYKKPRLTILSTGDELVGPSEVPEYCQIRDVNAYVLASLAEETGAEILSIGIIGDQFDIYQVSAADALKKSDIVLLSGGTSVGNKDLTAKVIDSLGSPGVITHGMAIKPGMTTIIGVFKTPEKVKAIVGLPGQPISAIVVFEAIIKGFLKKYYFSNVETPQSLMAVVSESIYPEEGCETYQLVSLERMGGEEESESGVKKAPVLQKAPSVLVARPVHAKESSVSQLQKADGYVVLPANTAGVEAGSLVEVVMIGK